MLKIYLFTVEYVCKIGLSKKHVIFHVLHRLTRVPFKNRQNITSSFLFFFLGVQNQECSVNLQEEKKLGIICPKIGENSKGTSVSASEKQFLS